MFDDDDDDDDESPHITSALLVCKICH